MKQKSLSKWLKCIIVGVGLCCLVIFAYVSPVLGTDLCSQYPEFSNRFVPWMIFIWIAAIPCFVALCISWRIATNIGQNRSFTLNNAKLLKWVSVLSAGDAALFFVGNVLFLFLDLSHPGVVLASFLVVFLGVAISVVFAALSHFVRKAASLQEQSDWTI